MSCSSGPKIITEGLVFNLDPSNSKSYPAKDDPYRNDVSLLLDFDGANGSTAFVDKSLNNLTVTAFGNAQISTTQSKFGGSSVYFDGNGDYITATSGSLFQFSGDFTIEFWAYSTETSSSSLRGMFDTRSSQFSAGGIMLRENGTGYLVYGNASTLITTGAVRTANTWTHLALVRSGSTITLYVNGTSAGTATNSTNYSDGQCLISGFIDTKATPYGFLGYIDDLRVTKAARYTSSFTPSDRLTALPARAYDLKNDATATLTNSPAFSNVQNGVISFDGSNDWISIPASSPLTFGTSDFTIDVWYRPRAKTNSYPQIIGNNITWQANCWSFVDRHASTNPTKFSFFVYNYSSTPALLVSSTAPSNNNWYNLTITRVGSTFSMYVNGILEATATSAASLDGGVSYTVAVGGDSVNGGTTIIDGNIGNLRIYKSKGLSASEVSQNYVANRQKYVEIPKTFSGLVAWFDGTDLSTLRQNSNATTAAILNSDPVGYWGDKSNNGRDATQSTSGLRPTLVSNARNQKSAISFNGSQWIQLSNSSNYYLGSNDFTIEGMFMLSAINVPSTLISKDLVNNRSWHLLWDNSTNRLLFQFFAATNSNSTSASYGVSYTPVANTWFHVAVVRSGATVTMYINGIAQSPTSAFSGISAPNNSANIILGMHYADWNGYNLRGSIQYAAIYSSAKYNSNFAPVPWL